MPAGRLPPYGWANGAPGRGAQRGTEGTERRLEWRDRANRQPVWPAPPGRGSAWRSGVVLVAAARGRRCGWPTPATSPKVRTGGWWPAWCSASPTCRPAPSSRPAGTAACSEGCSSSSAPRPCSDALSTQYRGYEPAASRRCAGSGWPTCRRWVWLLGGGRWPPWSSCPAPRRMQATWRSPGSIARVRGRDGAWPRPRRIAVTAIDPDALGRPPSRRRGGGRGRRPAGRALAPRRRGGDDPLPAWLLAGGVVAVLGVLPSTFDGLGGLADGAERRGARCCSSPPSRSWWSGPSSRSCGSPRAGWSGPRTSSWSGCCWPPASSSSTPASSPGWAAWSAAAARRGCWSPPPGRSRCWSSRPASASAGSSTAWSTAPATTPCRSSAR